MYKYFKKHLIGIIFIIATFMGVFHHHSDLLQHNDCQICTIQSSIADADTPVAVVYFTILSVKITPEVQRLKTLHSKILINPLNARAPPKIV